jgi:hypothetical protein
MEAAIEEIFLEKPLLPATVSKKLLLMPTLSKKVLPLKPHTDRLEFHSTEA